MMTALLRTFTELLDSKKAAYGFVATLLAALLVIYFKVPAEQALIIVSPLGLALAGQAHVDAASAKQPKQIEGQLLEVSYGAPLRSAAGTSANPTDEPGTTSPT